MNFSIFGDHSEISQLQTVYVCRCISDFLICESIFLNYADKFFYQRGG